MQECVHSLLWTLKRPSVWLLCGRFSIFICFRNKSTPIRQIQICCQVFYYGPPDASNTLMYLGEVSPSGGWGAFTFLFVFSLSSFVCAHPQAKWLDLRTFRWGEGVVDHGKQYHDIFSRGHVVSWRLHYGFQISSSELDEKFKKTILSQSQKDRKFKQTTLRFSSMRFILWGLVAIGSSLHVQLDFVFSTFQPSWLGI